MLFLPLLCAPAHADADASALWLATDQVAVGLATDGSLTNSAVGLGLRFDPDGPEGPYPAGGDAILPGRDFELWSVESTRAGLWVMGAPDPGSDLTLRWDEPMDSGLLTWIHGEGDAGDFTVEVWTVLAWGEAAAWMLIELTAQADLGEVWLARVYDPDLDHWMSGAYTTDNLAGAGYAVASGATDGRAWALAAQDGVGGICSWCTAPSAVLEGAERSADDSQLGVAVGVGTLSAGQHARVLFAYGFGLDAEEARTRAEDAAASDDLDGDGVAWTEDCDDLDAGASPGLPELPDNGRDDDCDGTIDEDEDGGGGGGGGDEWSDRDDWDAPFAEPSTREAVPEAGGGSGGCAVAGGAGPFAIFLAAFLGFRRRFR